MGYHPGNMTTQRTKKEATYEDVLAAPENMVAEVLNGNLVTSPRPAPRHTAVSSSVGGELYGPFHRGRGGPGGWWILDEPELHLGRDILVPDIAGWRRERLPQLPDEAYFSLSPDWACEVLSDSTRSHDRVGKMPAYARHEVRHLWLIDPVAMILEVFQLEKNRWLSLSVHGGDEVVRAAPFELIEIELASLWERGDPPTP